MTYALRIISGASAALARMFHGLSAIHSIRARVSRALIEQKALSVLHGCFEFL